MSVPPGTRIGPFDIVDSLGEGGMGVVHRAYDSRLRRHVAIKMLPPVFAHDPDRLRRFEQEALAVARLAHPNILAVHDVGMHDGSPYMVTELLEGATLRETMLGRALPVRLSVEYAAQVAHGLAAAHEHGIVHRDIKPENLFVSRDGRLKILDFGLAKITDLDTPADASAATVKGHETGMAGTAAYMAPEQVRGGRTDGRADLFSLGVVLHEMLSGVSPFRRPTSAETMTAILRDDVPDVPASAACPPGLQRVLTHCLEKDPAHRFQTARDLAFALESMPGTGPLPPIAVPPRTPRRVAVAAALITALGATGVTAFLVGRGVAPSEPRQEIAGIHRLTDFPGLEEFPAISPDLKAVAFTARVGGDRQIFVRLMSGGTPLQVTRDSGDHGLPRWTPDSSSLVYFAPAAPGDLQGALWEIPALGGAPRRMIESVGGGDIGPNGRIAAFRLAGSRIELITASRDGGDVRLVSRFAEPAYFKYPRWSPDERWIAYQRGDGVRWDVFAAPAAGGNPRQLTHDNTQIHGLSWRADSAALVYSSSRGSTMPYLPTIGLWETPIAGGEPRRFAASDLSYLYPDTHANTLVASRLHTDFDLWSHPVDGSPLENVRRASRITRQTGQVQTPTVGASAEQIAFLSDSGGHSNLWITAPATGELRQVTYERDPGVALGVPIWSPDGKWIAFVSSRGNSGLGFGVWIVSPDGGNLRQVVSRGLGGAWSPDSASIYYTDGGVAYRVALGGGAPARVRAGAVRNMIGLSHGTLYFMVDRTLADGSPGFEIHAAAPEDGPSRVLARIAPSRAPQWQIINPSLSPDGAWLAMPLTDGVTTNIWTLSTSTGEWRQITDFGDRPTFIARRVAWSPDGRSIVAAIGDGDADIVVFEPAQRATR